MELPLSNLVFVYNDSETIPLGLLAEGKEITFTGIEYQHARNKANASAEFLIIDRRDKFSPSKAKMEQEILTQVFVE